MTDQRTAAAGIARGFVPWIAYWGLAGAGHRTAGVLTALGAALLLVLVARPGRQGGPMEGAALGLFAVDAVASLGLGLDLFARGSVALVPATLAALALGSLAVGRPFTAVYARWSTPAEYWRQPLFRRVNALLTGIWGVVFSVNALLGLAALRWAEHRAWLALVLPQAGIAVAVAASLLLPRRLPRRWAAAQIAAREPYRWPVPAFGRPGAGHDVIVVGAGIGGLTAAALLARRGLRVLVLEQHFLAGGFCTSWPRLVRRGSERLRYVFDAGVHDVSGLGPRGAVRHLLRRLELESRVQWRRMTHEYRLPGLALKVHGAADFAGALGARFPAEAPAIARFFAQMEGVYRDLYADVHLTDGVPVPPATVDAMLAWPSGHPDAARWMDVPFGEMLDLHFRDPRLKEALAMLTGYLSADPRRLTVGAMAPIFGYYFDGGFYPEGGSQSFADALVERFRADGGELRLRTAVRRITVEGGRVTGVETAAGQRLPAAAVVANSDLRRTLSELVATGDLPPAFVRQVRALRPSTSAFAVFLGLDRIPDLEPITMVADGPQRVGIAIPSKVDAELAPPGHATVTLLTLLPAEMAGWDRRSPGYTARKRAFAERLIDAAAPAIPDLRRAIVYRQEGTPATFARYAWTTGGAIYGPALGWRPPVKTPVAGLVLAGAGVFPGAGVEAVVISGTLAANALCPSGVVAPPSGDRPAPLAAPHSPSSKNAAPASGLNR